MTTRAYFDASAIVKLVRHEPETLALFDLLDRDLDACTSALSEVEVMRALARLGTPTADVGEALRSFYLVDIDAGVRARAARLAPTGLRSLNAIHLATALEVGGDLTLVTYDDRLAEAARSMGLEVASPGLAVRD